MILRQPLVVLKFTPLYESISNIPRDPESQIWGPSGPYQSPETTQDIPNKVVFTLAWFWIVKIILPWPKVIPIPFPAQKSVSTIPGDPAMHILSPRTPY